MEKMVIAVCCFQTPKVCQLVILHNVWATSWNMKGENYSNIETTSWFLLIQSSPLISSLFGEEAISLTGYKFMSVVVFMALNVIEPK